MGLLLKIVRWTTTILVVAVGVARAPAEEAAATLEIDADYPGGNIHVERIEGDTVHIAQDLRDTSQWWFYFNFRVRGAASASLLSAGRTATK